MTTRYVCGSHTTAFSICACCDSNNFSISVAYIQTRQLSTKLTLSSFSSALVEEATTEGKPDGLILGVSDIGSNSANGDLAGDVMHFERNSLLAFWFKVVFKFLDSFF